VPTLRADTLHELPDFSAARLPLRRGVDCFTPGIYAQLRGPHTVFTR